MGEATEEKRRQPRRYPQSVIGAWYHLPGSAEEYDIIISNVSSRGLGIVSGISVEPGTFIKIFSGHLDKGILGEVRWCAPDSWGLEVYDLGIRAVKWFTAR